MLVLTRKIGESIIIDNDINVQILEMRGKQVRIGISAPESVLVLREELRKKSLAAKNSGINIDLETRPLDDDTAA